jgi:hypothetical protein
VDIYSADLVGRVFSFWGFYLLSEKGEKERPRTIQVFSPALSPSPVSVLLVKNIWRPKLLLEIEFWY